MLVHDVMDTDHQVSGLCGFGGFDALATIGCFYDTALYEAASCPATRWRRHRARL